LSGDVMNSATIYMLIFKKNIYMYIVLFGQKQYQ
jgi:hypothetical protein